MCAVSFHATPVSAQMGLDDETDFSLHAKRVCTALLKQAKLAEAVLAHRQTLSWQIQQLAALGLRHKHWKGSSPALLCYDKSRQIRGLGSNKSAVAQQRSLLWRQERVKQAPDEVLEQPDSVRGQIACLPLLVNSQHCAPRIGWSTQSQIPSIAK